MVQTLSQFYQQFSSGSATGSLPRGHPMTAPTVSPKDREEAVALLRQFAENLERFARGLPLQERLASAIRIVLEGER